MLCHGPVSSQDAQLKRLMREHIEKIDKNASKLKIPEFAEGKDWFNSPALKFGKELDGKIVVLDFWTYCCINCIHVLPDLVELEKKYAGYPVAFVGVHSAKFDNEKVSENIRQAVLRYEIEHPVINDDEMTLWRSIGVRAWPSMVVVGPKNNILLMVSGENKKQIIDTAISEALNFYPPDLFKHDPVPISLERDKVDVQKVKSPLRFPAKLAYDKANKRIFISDSNNNRIIVTDKDGQFLTSIGNGRIGLQDGSFSEARFNRPQGLTWYRNKLYVADAENHGLREIDFEKEKVKTLAGNGIQGRDYSGGKSGAQQLLSTPWDVMGVGDKVFIAMAGTHQIWAWDLQAKTASNFSGDGSEQNLNGKGALKVAWSQPSGLASNGVDIFIADSESSTIRGLKIESNSAFPIVGGDVTQPRNLFDFGDVDGVGDDAGLQHPLGVFMYDDNKSVLVADTYNHKIKILNPEERKIVSLAGVGHSGYKDGSFEDALFAEPSGFCQTDDDQIFLVADTNNHLIRKLDLRNKQVSTFELKGVPEAMEPYEHGEWDLTGFSDVKAKKVSLQMDLSTSGPIEIPISIKLPQGQKINELAESRWQVKGAGSNAQSGNGVTQIFTNVKGVIDPENTSLSLFINPGKLNLVDGKYTIEFESVVYYCGVDDTTCKVGHIRRQFILTDSSASESKEKTPLPLELEIEDMTRTIHSLLEIPSAIPLKKD